MHRGRKQRVMFRKLLAPCQWGYGGRYDQGSDYVDSGTLELLSLVDWSAIGDFKLADDDQNCSLKRSFWSKWGGKQRDYQTNGVWC